MLGRKYIILKNEFSTAMKTNIKGHCKIERKGSRNLLSVNIENGEREKVYTVSFITKDMDNPILDLGKIFIDEFGRGKGDYYFSINDMIGILIMEEGNILLGEYMDKDDGSIESYIKNRNPSVIENEISKDFEPVEKTKIVEEPTFMEEPESIEELKPMEEIIEEILEDTEKDSIETDYITIDTIKEINKRNKTINFTLSILRHFPYIEPLKLSLKGYNWWLADLNAENKYREYLPYFSHIIGGNTKETYKENTITSYQLINKYRHYLFGIYNENEDIKYFIFGIPGLFIGSEHPHRGNTGFNTWFEGKNIGGYWIVYIDPSSGAIIKMPVPMIPTE